MGGLIPAGELLEVWTVLILLGISRKAYIKRGYQVSLWILVWGGIRISSRFRTYPLGKTRWFTETAAFLGKSDFKTVK